MVFQTYALYPHKTVGANMGFALKLRGMDKAAIAAKVNRPIRCPALTPCLDRYSRALSGGQRQQVAMARAILRDPQVFLFDVPLSNLDAKLREQMRTEIRKLHLRLKTTTVHVTQDQIAAMTMADRIVVMQGGRHEGRYVVAMFHDWVPFRPGDALTLVPDTGKVHLFDRATGVRIS